MEKPLKANWGKCSNFCLCARLDYDKFARGLSRWYKKFTFLTMCITFFKRSLMFQSNFCGKLDRHFTVTLSKVQFSYVLLLFQLEPVIRMSHENISVEDFYCKFAPNFEFVLIFKKCMTECSQQICLHSTWALWDKAENWEDLNIKVNINWTTGANLQFLKFNRNVLVTHSYNWL